jgi:exonuclease SbcC
MDADVVLIYGPNGSGKTALILAMEYAITGEVADLRLFADDYPRCLRHVRSMDDPRVSVHFTSESGETCHLSMPHDVGRRKPGTAEISEVDRRSYVERCYLSQFRLARLLEIYQAVDKDNPEQPLVRFVRELLGLDLLENLTIGLHEAGNILRLEKSCYSLGRLKQEEDLLPSQRERFQQQMRDGGEAWSQSLASIHALIPEFGDPVSGAPWTAAGLRARIQQLEADGASEQDSQALRTLQRARGELESAVGLFRAAGRDVQEGALPALLARLDWLQHRRSEIESLLLPICKRAEERLGIPPQAEELSDIDQKLAAIGPALRSRVASLDAEMEAAAEIESRLHSLETRAAELQKVVGEIEPASSEKVQERKGWAQALRLVLDRLEGDVCPVCGRDYSELKSGELKSRVVRELNALGQDIEDLDRAIQRRAQVETEYHAVLAQVSGLKTRVAEQSRALKATQSLRQDLIKIGDELAAASQPRQEWAALNQEEARLRSDLRAGEARQQQRDGGRQVVGRLADELNIPAEARPSDTESLAEAISGRLTERIDKAEKRTQARLRLREAFLNAEKVAVELETLDKRIDALNLRQEELREVRSKVDTSLKRARSLALAANKAKDTLLKEVFNDTLNGLWADLFERLVKGETFLPRLSPPTLKRGQIRAAIQATTRGTEPFQQAGSVLSASNLNIAALSLFLSLNLVEQPNHRVLVLDDPIQSMDDIHVVQLASLLRAVVHQAGRQLVLAVHEQSLYDYLRVELGPTRDSDTLICIELTRDGDSSAIRHEKHQWKPDRVVFGT